MSANLTTMLAGETLTMSSREIAELCEKEHFNVLIDIRKMFSDLQIGDLSFQGSYISAQNKAMPEYNLPKDLTITLVSGYKVQLRHRIVTRWMELESQQNLKLNIINLYTIHLKKSVYTPCQLHISH